MRRSVLTSVALLSVFLAGCEDGPNQTYSPAPAGAATSWNNAGADASYADPATQNYDAGGGGTNAVNVCNAQEQSIQWSTAFNVPIIPPFGVGGIDLSAGGTFTSVTIEDVINGTSGQAKLCQGSAGACTDGSSDVGYAWGPSQQLNTCYDNATHEITFFLMQPGYNGTLSFTLPHLYNGQPVPLAVDDANNPVDLNYVWEVGQHITVNGQVLTGPKGGALWSPAGIDPTVANQMYLGLMYTFQPTLLAVTNPTTNPPLTEMTDPNSNCLVNAKCRTSINGDLSQGNFGVRPVGMYFDAAESQSADPATAAEPGDLYIFPVKFEPFSLAPYNEGLDSFASKNADPALLFNSQPVYGPYSPAGVLSPPGTPQKPFCTLYMGEPWSQFTNNCVNVSGNAAIDKTSTAKLIGAQHHEAEWFQFSVVGVNQNFSADTAELTQNGTPGVLQDSEQQPNPDDIATDFYVDVRSAGAKLNDQRGDSTPPSPVSDPGNCSLDKKGNCPTACSADQCEWVYEDANLAGQDLHGTAAVLGYFRGLVQDAITTQMIAYGITPAADPKTCWFDSSPYTDEASLNTALQAWQAPPGCTGFEQMVLPDHPQGTNTYTDMLDVTVENTAPDSVFQPGDPELDFYADPVNLAGENNNVTAPNLFQAALSQVTAILGHGNINALPPNTRDWRFYFQYWAQAFTGYLLNRSKNPTWLQLYNDSKATVHTLRQVNEDDLFFDLNNGLDKFEYVDRTDATTLGAPVDFEYDILLPTSNTQTNNFYQRLTRGESAMYESMITADSTGSKAGQVPGSNENIFLTDLFGSPAIANAADPGGAPYFSGAVDPVTRIPIPGKDTYYCATTVPTDPDCPNGAPVDANGNLLVDGIGRPLFTNYKGIFYGTAFTIGSDIPIKQTLPYIGGAIVNLPSYADPYNLKSANSPIAVYVPWLPSQPGTGFDIPINGQRTQFIQTGTLDFSGVTTTASIDYLPVNDPTSGALTDGIIAAVETQDFLGETFLCVDPPTGDILRAKMYSSTLDIVNWLERHPGAQTACNIFIRYSPYNNYPDYITSVTNGVLLSVNKGAGDGPSRIGDATLFNPALLTQTQ